MKKNLPKITTPRDTIITRALLRKKSISRIYGGSSKNTLILNLSRDLRGHHVGEYSLTKKLGSFIHDSARNKKRKKKK